MSGSVTAALDEVYRVAKEYGIDLSEQVGDAEDVQIKALAWFAANMPEILDLPEEDDDLIDDEIDPSVLATIRVEREGVFKYMLNRRSSEFDTQQEKEMD